VKSSLGIDGFIFFGKVHYFFSNFPYRSIIRPRTRKLKFFFVHSSPAWTTEDAILITNGALTMRLSLFVSLKSDDDLALSSLS